VVSGASGVVPAPSARPARRATRQGACSRHLGPDLPSGHDRAPTGGYWLRRGAKLTEVDARITREQRCWFHRIANVLAGLPKSAHPGAKKALAEIWSAEDGEHAEAAAKAFADAYGAKFPKAVAKIVDDLEELLAFYDFPAEHWVHLRTTNPIESTFATVRHRTKVTKGPGSKPPASRWPSS